MVFGIWGEVISSSDPFLHTPQGTHIIPTSKQRKAINSGLPLASLCRRNKLTKVYFTPHPQPTVTAHRKPQPRAAPAHPDPAESEPPDLLVFSAIWENNRLKPKSREEKQTESNICTHR